MAALLEHKASRQLATHWYAGRRQAPQWALDMLASKLAAIARPRLQLAEQLRRLPPRIGKRAGAKNLAAYNARKNKAPG